MIDLHKAVAAAFLALASVFASPASAETIEGRASVVDGDTLAVEGTKARIRLYGMDAPESKQTCDDASGRRYLCGSRAAEALAEIIGRNGRVKCFAEDRDRYGRIVAECATPQGVVVNAAMIEAGWALEYRAYSDGRYAGEEREAKAAKRGLWAGEFVEPAQWRRGERLPSERGTALEEPASASAGCRIKGNISGSGRIYHMPGTRSYAETKIDEGKGERWFCSEAEAKAAGWRAPRG